MNKERLREVIRLNLISLRINKGITQSDIAAITNKSKNAVASWEQGKSLPDVTTLYELSKFYHKNMEYFYTENNEDWQASRLTAYSRLLREKVIK